MAFWSGIVRHSRCRSRMGALSFCAQRAQSFSTLGLATHHTDIIFPGSCRVSSVVRRRQRGKAFDVCAAQTRRFASSAGGDDNNTSEEAALLSEVAQNKILVSNLRMELDHLTSVLGSRMESNAMDLDDVEMFRRYFTVKSLLKRAGIDVAEYSDFDHIETWISGKDPNRSEVDSGDEEKPTKAGQMVSRVVPQEIDELGRAYAVGRRKESSAQVYISLNKECEGTFVVNGRSIDDYLHSRGRFGVAEVYAPLLSLGLPTGRFDVLSKVRGGGITGQIGALRLGLARALQKFEPTFRPKLRKEGYLTRDSRSVERKKPGQKKARKKFTWVKR